MKLTLTLVLMVAMLPAVALGEPPTSRPARPNWDRALEFFRENSPKRWAAYEKLPDNKKAELRPMIMGRYVGMNFLNKDNPQLHELRKKQLQVEDDVFDLRNQLSAKRKDPDLEGQLKEKVTELVGLRMEERANKIQQLQKLLEDEQKKLKEDEDRKDRVVDREYNAILNGRNPDAFQDHPRRPAHDSREPRPRDKDGK
jgi:hypothetical protein